MKLYTQKSFASNIKKIYKKLRGFVWLFFILMLVLSLLPFIGLTALTSSYFLSYQPYFVMTTRYIGIGSFTISTHKYYVEFSDIFADFNKPLIYIKPKNNTIERFVEFSDHLSKVGGRSLNFYDYTVELSDYGFTQEYFYNGSPIFYKYFVLTDSPSFYFLIKQKSESELVFYFDGNLSKKNNLYSIEKENCTISFSLDSNLASRVTQNVLSFEVKNTSFLFVRFENVTTDCEGSLVDDYANLYFFYPLIAISVLGATWWKYGKE